MLSKTLGPIWVVLLGVVVLFGFFAALGLFAPAEVWVSNIDSGRTWHAGALNMDLLHELWLES